MKYALLFLSFVPFLLTAQSMYNDPRGWKLVPAGNVKSVTITGLVEVRRESKPDTMFQEFNTYGEDGRQSEKAYRAVIDKSTYHSKTDFHYWDGMFYTLGYVNGKLHDSTIVRGDSAWRYLEGDYLKHIYAGDSVKEAETVNGIRIIDETRWLGGRDSFWDYRNAGNFSRKTITTGTTTDTVRYWSEQDECLVMIVNVYNESRNVTWSEYYNYGVKTFEFTRYHYNEKLDITYYLEKSKKGAPSFTVARKYDEKGMLTEERYTGTNKKEGILIKRYEYTYY